jgi:hypothetical protein
MDARGGAGMERTGGAADRARAAANRQVARRVEDVAWAWTYGYISDAVFERLIAALAREIADRIAPPARATPGMAAQRPARSP